MVYLRHDSPNEPGAELEARRFQYAILDEAVAQAKHDLARAGTAPLVAGVFDEHGKRLRTVKQIRVAA